MVIRLLHILLSVYVVLLSKVINIAMRIGFPLTDGASVTPRSRRYKRPFDLTVLALLYMAFLPIWVLLWLLIPLAIYLFDRGPIFYVQERVGMNGRRFQIIKFRTMIRDAEQDSGPVWAVPNDQRITRLGSLLRHSRMDEIPQAINVLRGEMSLVGPRPERPELTEAFSKQVQGFESRLAVQPGIAGLAHVRGDSYTKPRNRLRYDNLYIQNMGPMLDLKLIVLSVFVSIRAVLRWSNGQQV